MALIYLKSIIFFILFYFILFFLRDKVRSTIFQMTMNSEMHKDKETNLRTTVEI